MFLLYFALSSVFLSFVFKSVICFLISHLVLHRNFLCVNPSKISKDFIIKKEGEGVSSVFFFILVTKSSLSQYESAFCLFFSSYFAVWTLTQSKSYNKLHPTIVALASEAARLKEPLSMESMRRELEKLKQQVSDTRKKIVHIRASSAYQTYTQMYRMGAD